MNKIIISRLLLAIIVFQLGCGPRSNSFDVRNSATQSYTKVSRQALLADPVWEMRRPRGEVVVSGSTDGPDIVPPTPYTTSIGDDGSAQVSVPIWVPPGRNGIQPLLSLVYSSRAGAGFAGLGATLTGLSSIDRCWPSYAVDGAITPAERPNAFCLDGKRLLHAGDYFFVEGDPGTRVQFDGAAESPSHFIVETKDGLRSSYGMRDGRSDDSKSKVTAADTELVPTEFGSDRVTATTTTPLVTVGWRIDHVEDRFGNYLDVDYERILGTTAPQTVEVFPVKIRYAANDSLSLPFTREVTFTYRARNRSEHRRIGRVPVVSTRVLETIKVFSEMRLTTAMNRPGSLAEVRRYEFTYLPNSGGRSLDRLSTVRECFSNDSAGGTTSVSCAVPVTLEWGGTSNQRLPTFTTTPSRTIGATNGNIPNADIPFSDVRLNDFLFDIADAVVGDFDGDGFDDYLVRTPKTFAALTPVRIDAQWHISRGSAEGLTAPVAVSGLPGGAGSSNLLTPRVTDLNLDGADEVISILSHAYPTTPLSGDAYDALSLDGGNFERMMIGETLQSALAPDRAARSANFVLGDLDGDGIPDLLTDDALVVSNGIPITGPTNGGMRLRRGVLTSGVFTFAPTIAVPFVPGGNKPIPTDERHLLDSNGDGVIEFLSRPPAHDAATGLGSAPSFVEPRAPSLHSAVFDPSALNLPTTDTHLWARDLSASFVLSQDGCSTPVPGYALPMRRLLLDADGDGLRDAVSFPSIDSDRCSATQPNLWAGIVLTSLNIGGQFLAPIAQNLASGPNNTVRIGPSVVLETAPAWGGTLMDDRMSADGGIPLFRTMDNGLRVMDFDEDGRQDLVVLAHQLVTSIGPLAPYHQIAVALSNGDGTFAPFAETGLMGALGLVPAVHGASYGWERGSGPRSARVGDFNGDGHADMAMLDYFPSGTGGAVIRVHQQNAKAPDVVLSASAGPHSAKASFAYEYFGPASTSVLAHEPCTVNPGPPAIIQQCPKRFGYVVRQLSREVAAFDESTVQTLETSYRYGAPVIDTRGRGFLGFSKTSQTTEGVTTSVETTFTPLNLAHGFIYQRAVVRSTERMTPAGRYRTVSDTSYEYGPASRTGWAPVKVETKQAVFEGGSTTGQNEIGTIADTSISYFDEYGTPNRQETVWSDNQGNVVSRHEVHFEQNAPDEQEWLVARYQRKTETSEEHGSSASETVVRTTSFDWEPGRPVLRTVTDEPDESWEKSGTNGLRLASTISYDSAGNVSSIEATNGTDSRLTSYGFDQLDLQFLLTETNPLAHVATTHWHTGYGVPFASDDPNQVRATVTFDTFLRPVERKDGLIQGSTGLDQGGPTVKYNYTKMMRTVLAPFREYSFCATSTAAGLFCKTIDPVGHATSVAKSTVTGTTAKSFTYDRLGRITAETLPSVAGRTPIFIIRQYDSLGRVTREETPGESLSAPRLVTTFDYQPDSKGLSKVVITDARLAVHTNWSDRRGRPARSSTKDAVGQTLRDLTHVFGPFDLLRFINHPQLDTPMTPPPTTSQPTTELVYDVRGRTVRLVDPDLGTEERLFSAFGELKQVTDANGGVTTTQRDLLGRPTQISTAANAAYQGRNGAAAQETVFNWDVATGGIGNLESAESVDEVLTTFRYDEYGRLFTATWGRPNTCIGSPSVCVPDGFTFKHEYDSSGRLEKLHYPPTSAEHPFSIRYEYQMNDEPKAIWDISKRVLNPTEPEKLLWSLIAENGPRISEQQFGQATRNVRTFDAAQQLRYVETKSSLTGAALQRLAYQWDKGFIASKTDLSVQATEAYKHDALGRLTDWTVIQNCNSADWKYKYDNWGNLRERERISGPGQTQVSEYTNSADDTRPHAVKTLTAGTQVTSYEYDASGHVKRIARPSDSVEIQWTPFGLPNSMTDGFVSEQYEHDAFQSRFSATTAVAGPIKTHITIKDLFDVNADLLVPAVDFAYTVMGTEGVLARVTRSSTDGFKTQTANFMHADHLGTPDTVSNASGDVVERLKFDPFGERRHPWAIAHPVSDSGVLDPMLGFTGHKAANRFGVIHMRGRIYDPLAANFLSGDPVLNASAGRYAYVNNSPVMRVDPSGYQDASPGASQDEGEAESKAEKFKRIAFNGGMTSEDWRELMDLLPSLPHTKGPLKPATPLADQNAGTGFERKDEGVEEALEKRTATLDAVEGSLDYVRPFAEVAAQSNPYIAASVALAGESATGGQADIVDRLMGVPWVGILAFNLLGKTTRGVLGLRNGERVTLAAGGAPKLLGPGTNIGAKIEKQMAGRGWNRAAVDKLISSPHSTRAVRDTRHLPGGGQLDDPATAYVNRQGHYVIRNERTGDIVQMSNRHDLDWVAPWD